VGHSLLIIEVSPSHSGTVHSIGLLWTSDQPEAQTSTWQSTILTRDRYTCTTAGFELAVQASQPARGHRLTTETARPPGPANY